MFFRQVLLQLCVRSVKYKIRPPQSVLLAGCFRPGMIHVSCVVCDSNGIRFSGGWPWAEGAPQVSGTTLHRQRLYDD